MGLDMFCVQLELAQLVLLILLNVTDISMHVIDQTFGDKCFLKILKYLMVRPCIDIIMHSVSFDIHVIKHPLKAGSCPNDENSIQILFCPFLCNI